MSGTMSRFYFGLVLRERSPDLNLAIVTLGLRPALTRTLRNLQGALVFEGSGAIFGLCCSALRSRYRPAALRSPRTTLATTKRCCGQKGKGSARRKPRTNITTPHISTTTSPTWTRSPCCGRRNARKDGPVDQFDTPVYQLMDKQVPGPVEKLDPIRLPGEGPQRLRSVRIDKQNNKHCEDIGQDVCEVLGRNTWMMWPGGNEGFWDWLGRRFGILDFLKLLDTKEIDESVASRSDPKASKSKDRDSRFERAGLINEPEMGPSLDEPDNVIERVLGLRLDEPTDKEVREWRRKYVRMALRLDSAGSAPAQSAPYGGPAAYGGVLPGAAAGYPNGKSYDPRIPPPEIYGLSSGVVGLRLFPNPLFDAKARAQVGSEEILRGSEGRSRDDPAVSRRHGLRVLPRVLPPAQSAAGSDQPGVGEHLREHRRAVPPGTRGLRQHPAEKQSHLPHPRQPAAGHDRHLAHRLGQHQQPEHNERGVQPASAGAHIVAQSPKERGAALARGCRRSGAARRSQCAAGRTGCHSTAEWRGAIRRGGGSGEGARRVRTEDNPNDTFAGCRDPARRRGLDRRLGRARPRLPEHRHEPSAVGDAAQPGRRFGATETVHDRQR